jgi:hypothetical protein
MAPAPAPVATEAEELPGIVVSARVVGSLELTPEEFRELFGVETEPGAQIVEEWHLPAGEVHGRHMVTVADPPAPIAPQAPGRAIPAGAAQIGRSAFQPRQQVMTPPPAPSQAMPPQMVPMPPTSFVLPTMPPPVQPSPPPPASYTQAPRVEDEAFKRSSAAGILFTAITDFEASLNRSHNLPTSDCPEVDVAKLERLINLYVVGAVAKLKMRERLNPIDVGVRWPSPLVRMLRALNEKLCEYGPYLTEGQRTDVDDVITKRILKAFISLKSRSTEVSP